MRKTNKIIPKMRTALFAASIAFTLGACGAPQSTAEAKVDAQPQAFSAMGMSSVSDIHQAVFNAFDKTANPTAENYILAAQALDRLGARPIGDKNDRAQQWQQMALSMDADLAEKFPPFRGRVKGPAYREYTLAAGESDSIREIYYAAEGASLSVNPHKGDVTLSVTEADETAPVCNLKASAKIASCAWTPIFTSPYTITITNRSKTKVTYLLVSN